MDYNEFIETMGIVVSALKERGYNPYSQIYGYLKENDPLYITSYNGARELIQKMDNESIALYLNQLKTEY